MKLGIPDEAADSDLRLCAVRQALTDAIKTNAEALAAAHGLSIDYVRKKNFRKEDRVKEVLRRRGDHPGLVWIFSALEPCTTYQPWHDKKSGRTYLRPDDGKCLHYYFYFTDEELGLCYVRVPTWCSHRAIHAARKPGDALILLGAKTDRAEVEYGWIELQSRWTDRAIIKVSLPHLAAVLATRLPRFAASSANLTETVWLGGLR
jgi:hypothetical protein